MEENKKLDYDSDIIICEDIPETISVSTSPETIKKQKKKKCKRRVKRSINFNNNMETLLITQKLKVKKTKFKCVININTVCEKRSNSIVRLHTNVCKKEAYYHRIVPNCLREMCSGGSASCRRSTIGRGYNKYLCPKTGSISPVSSIPTEVLPRDISYEDVSPGSLSCASEEELDTLIKRTRQREKQFHNSQAHSARKYITSTPIPKADDIPSPISIDMDRKSIHSDNTVILNPLSTEAYTPTSFDVIKLDNLENDRNNDMIDIDVPYSPTMTPDLIKMENLDYSPVDRTLQFQREKQFHNSHSARKYITSTPMPKADHITSPFSIDMDRKSIHSDNTMILNPLSTEAYTPTSFDVIKSDNLENDRNNDMIDIDVPYSPTLTPDLIKMENLDYSPVDRTLQDNIPYSPTYTQETIEEVMDYDLKRNLINQPYLPIFTPDIEMENSGHVEYGNEPYSPTMTPDMIKMENLDYHVGRTNADEAVNVVYSPSSPAVTPDLYKLPTETDNSNDHIHNMQNVLYSPIAPSESMKQDNLDVESTIRHILAPKFSKLTSDQIKKEKEDHSNETDYNKNNTIKCKIERDDHQIGMHDQADPSEAIVKIEKDRTSDNYVHFTVFTNNVNIKTENC